MTEDIYFLHVVTEHINLGHLVTEDNIIYLRHLVTEVFYPVACTEHNQAFDQFEGQLIPSIRKK